MPFSSPIITPRLLSKVLAQYSLHPEGIHGIQHWERVEMNALRLAEAEGIESDVLPLFALFHDSRRLNEGRDPAHGHRGAALARQLHGEYFDLAADALDLLCHACKNHTRLTHHPDPIIGICWDADRLDLTRIGVQPNPSLLNREASRSRCMHGIDGDHPFKSSLTG